MNKLQAIHRINKDLATFPGMQKNCLTILEYVCEQDLKSLMHISFGELGSGAGLTNAADIIRACQYLVGARVPLFDPGFEFIDGDFVHPLPLDHVSKIRSENVFHHPLTGEVVDNHESKIFLFFMLSKAAMELHSSNTSDSGSR